MLSSCAHQTLVIYYTHFIHSTSMVYTAYTSFWTAMSFPWPFPPFPHLLQLPNCPLQLLQGLRVASKPTRLFVDLTLGIYIYIQYICTYIIIYIYYKLYIHMGTWHDYNRFILDLYCFERYRDTSNSLRGIIPSLKYSTDPQKPWF